MSTGPKMLSFSKPTPDFSRKFYNLYADKSMVDVTLSADGQFLQAHKVVLAVASSWFEELFDSLKDKDPVIVVKDLTIDQLTHIVEFIYLGAAHIPEDEAHIFKSTLESFRISLDDLENAEEFDEDDEVDDEEIEEPSHQDDQNEDQNGDDFHEKLFELIESEESAKKEDVQIKSEPEWDENVIKEEPAIPNDPVIEAPPSKIQLNKPVTVRRSNPQVTQPASNSIRIRTPASINEKLRLNEPIMRTMKIVQRHPYSIPMPPSVDTTNPTNIQELSKRLSKAILIRRIRKSDGSVVSERSPIKIVQGMRTSNGLPVIAHKMDPISVQHSKPQQTFRCSHCSKAFSVNKRRNAHEKFCFKNPSRPPSQCPFCPMVLCNPMYISTHIRKVHGIDENGQTLKPELTSVAPEGTVMN